jgi:circadian clock protein KaiC
VGPGGVLTGSARLAQEAQERATETEHEQQMERQRIELDRKRKALELQIAALRAEFDVEEAGYLKTMKQDQARETQLEQNRIAMELSRKADARARQRNGSAK